MVDKKHCNGDHRDLLIQIARLEEKLNASEKSLVVAYSAMDKRLEGMNEFREQLNRQAASFLTKETYEGKHEALQLQVDALRINEATLAGKASQKSVMISNVLSIIAIIISLSPPILHLISK